MAGTSVLFIVLLGSLIGTFVRGSSQLPRGASPADSALYTADGSGHFTCRDGSKKIPFSRVNDDYCDCEDGSDEPGTSACLQGMFHCANRGDEPKTLRSMYVDDGVCDCCDGTDEPRGTCKDVCFENGKETLKRVETELADAKNGLSKRSNLEKSVTLHHDDMTEDDATSEMNPLLAARGYYLAEGLSKYVYVMFPSLTCMAMFCAGRRQILAGPGRSVLQSWRKWKVSRLNRKLQQRLPKHRQSQSLNV